jgi:hypothetical protein
LNRLIADALRRAEKPLASNDIAEAIVTEKGFGRRSIHALTRRVVRNYGHNSQLVARGWQPANLASGESVDGSNADVFSQAN